MKISVESLRENYTKGGLLKQDLKLEPIEQFKLWFEQAVESDILEPNAMTLATVSDAGKPVARIVLLKKIDIKGLTFFTNYDSRKGENLANNPWASLVFWWGELERQVRIEGRVEKIAPKESNEYFNSRPIGSQLGALASPQSQVIPDREYLENRLETLTNEYKNKTISRPQHWGGYRVVPNLVEFWQGRQNRLHDRFCYRLDNNQQWQIDRLAP